MGTDKKKDRSTNATSFAAWSFTSGNLDFLTNFDWVTLHNNTVNQQSSKTEAIHNHNHNF